MSLRACAITLFLLILGTVFAFTQGTKVRAQYDAITESEKDQPQRRELWFMHGRAIPNESAARLRYRAHQQKMRLRTLRAASDTGMALTPQPQADTTGGWKSLGPSPLASDATGLTASHLLCDSAWRHSPERLQSNCQRACRRLLLHCARCRNRQQHDYARFFAHLTCNRFRSERSRSG
jgi:hypothetical protein